MADVNYALVRETLELKENVVSVPCNYVRVGLTCEI